MSGSARNGFSSATLDILSKRVALRCSNPSCRQPTAGPSEIASSAVNIGVGAHIHAASPGGPRFDSFQTPEERAAIENGIWLCQNCAKLVDNDVRRYTPEVLKDWKARAERLARDEIEGEARPETAVAIEPKRRNVTITGRRHDYRLQVAVRNLGTKVVRNYHADLIFPTAVLTRTDGRIEARSDRNGSLFRKAWAGPNDDIYPGDAPLFFDLEYHMTDVLFRQRDHLFNLPVTVALFADDKRLGFVDERFETYQTF